MTELGVEMRAAAIGWGLSLGLMGFLGCAAGADSAEAGEVASGDEIVAEAPADGPPFLREPPPGPEKPWNCGTRIRADMAAKAFSRRWKM